MPYGEVPNRVRRRQIKRVAALVPQTAQAAIFRVAGGPVRLRSLIGKFTVAANATATNLTVVINPTVGADVSLSAALAIASLAIGHVLANGATVGAALGSNANGVIILPTADFHIPVGTIDLLTSASNATAQIEWTLDYESIDGTGTVSIA